MDNIECVRPLSEILKADPRNSSRGDIPTALYEALSQIQLNSSVPRGVRQLFETAKNLSLYTWFVYRFHPIARVVAYSCVEAALRHRVVGIAKFQNPEKPDWYPGFKGMLDHAVNEGWIRNEGFEVARIRAQSRARENAALAQIQMMTAEEIDSMPTSQPSEEEIQAELAGLPYARSLVEAWPAIRNWIAHGNGLVEPGSLNALRVTAEAINQLFPK